MGWDRKLGQMRMPAQVDRQRPLSGGAAAAIEDESDGVGAGSLPGDGLGDGGREVTGAIIIKQLKQA